MQEPGKFPERTPSALAPTGRDILNATGILLHSELVRVVQGKVIPHIIAGRVRGQPICVWVPACAGEEAYSIAIRLSECFSEQKANARVKIFVTDIDDAALATARARVYPSGTLPELGPQRFLRFISPFDGKCKVTSQVRQRCVFARQDVCKDPPSSKLDLIRFRQIQSLFEPSSRNKVFTKVHDALDVCGALMLGESLAFGETGDLFIIAAGTRHFFVKNATARVPHNGRRGAHRAVPDDRDITRKIPTRADLESENTVGRLDPAADQRELECTRRYLRAVIGERQTALAELGRIRQGALAGIERLETVCEELQSSNEELHSCNEELTTFKEELISSNQELHSLNQELKTRNDALARVADDFDNVLSALDIPIVVLDSQRAIRRFTAPAQSLFGLWPADVGRPITGLRLGINASELDRMISVVLETRSELKCELQKNGRWYSVRVRPFRTGDDKIEGLLMAWLDIHDLKQSQQALQNERNFVSAILDAAADLLVIVLDWKGRIAHFNRVCQQLTGFSLAEVQGRPLWMFLAVAQEAASLKADLQNPAFGKQRQAELEWVTKAGARQLIAWTFRPVLGEDGLVESVIATGIDQTRRAEAQVTVQESTATVHALLETAAQAILAVNQEGRIVLANAATEKMFGYRRQDLLGQPIERLIPQQLGQKHAMHRAKCFLEPVSPAMGARRELTGLRADGVEFPIEVSLSYLRNRHGVLGISFISDITERKKNEQALLDYQLQLQRLAARLISAQETENRELARELHDVFSQDLAALNMEISTILREIKTHSSLALQLAEVGKKIGRLAEEIHRTSRQLHPAVLNELGLETALHEECETLSEHSGMRVRLTSTNIPAALPEDVSLSLYRVAQESLYNIRKHVGATQVKVRLEGTADGVSLQVADSGDGFDVEERRKRGGLGLISMEERVRLIGGQFSIRSHAGIGTLVEVFVPLNLSEP